MTDVQKKAMNRGIRDAQIGERENPYDGIDADLAEWWRAGTGLFRILGKQERRVAA